MNENKDSEYYRKQEKLEHLKLLPLALFYLAVCSTAYVISVQEQIFVQDVVLIGAAKYVWIYVALLFGSITLFFVVGSLSFLVLASRMAKVGNFELHSWRPIVTATIFLGLGFASAYLGYYAHLTVLFYSEDITKQLGFGYGISGLLAIAGWTLIMSWTSSIVCALIYWVVRAPFNAKKINDWVNEYEEPE